MRLAALAWIACATHVAAALASVLLLLPGTLVEPDPLARAAYVEVHLTAWRLGWAAWILATVSLYALLREMAPRAAKLVLVGLAFDIPSQLALTIPLPWTLVGHLGSGLVANAIYTASLGRALREATLPRALVVGGFAVVLLGAAVALATGLMHPTALLVSAGGLSVALIAWTSALGVWASRASS